MSIQKDYIQKNTSNIDALFKANMPFIVIRTNEPFAVQERLISQAYIINESSPNKNYNTIISNPIDGTYCIKRDVDNNTEQQQILPLQRNVEVFIGINQESETNKIVVPTPDKPNQISFGNNFICIMNNMHMLLNPNQNSFIIAVTAIKKFYEKNHKNCDRTIFFIVPKGWEVPDEIKNDVFVYDYGDADDIRRAKTILDSIETFKKRAYEKVKNIVDNYNDDVKNNLINMTSSLTLSQIHVCLTYALYSDLSKNIATVTKNNEYVIDYDFVCTKVKEKKIDLIKSTGVLEFMEPTSIEKIGGMEKLKDYLKIRKKLFNPKAQQMKIKNPKGIMLVGPSGTGKSLVAKAVSDELKFPLIRLDISKLFSGIVGSTETKTREMLKMVEALAPCILFIDEIDKAIPSQNAYEGDSGVSKRMLGQILTWMQESENSGVYLVMTANRVGNLPAEFTRKGRIDDIFYIGLPNKENRKNIINIALKNRNQKPIEDLTKSLKCSENFSGAELDAAVEEALIYAFANDLSEVTDEMIANAINDIIPVSKSYAEQYVEMKSWAENNARSVEKENASLLDQVIETNLLAI